jgi:hypothetical protein
MTGKAAHSAMRFSEEYRNPAVPSTIQPTSKARRKAPGSLPAGEYIGLILAFGVFLSAARAEDPPPDLVRRVAQKETETQAARDHYTYRQTVLLEELDERGAKSGEFRETREVIFTPQEERIEQPVDKPRMELKKLKLTEEDYRDIREIQPFLLNQRSLRLYETKYRGEEAVDDIACYVLQVRPRQILDGQRLFDGMLWIDKKSFSIVRAEGQAVPQIRTTKSENLFPRFITVRKPVDGDHWFPVHTYADDTLFFKTAPVRIRLSIRYSEYKRFGAESTIKFEKAQ